LTNIREDAVPSSLANPVQTYGRACKGRNADPSQALRFSSTDRLATGERRVGGSRHRRGHGPHRAPPHRAPQRETGIEPAAIVSRAKPTLPKKCRLHRRASFVRWPNRRAPASNPAKAAETYIPRPSGESGHHSPRGAHFPEAPTGSWGTIP